MKNRPKTAFALWITIAAVASVLLAAKLVVTTVHASSDEQERGITVSITADSDEKQAAAVHEPDTKTGTADASPTATASEADSETSAAIDAEDWDDEWDTDRQKGFAATMDLDDLSVHNGGEGGFIAVAGMLTGIAIVAIVFFSPALLLGVVLYFVQLRHKHRHELMEEMIERGMEVPAPILEAYAQKNQPMSDQRKGILWLSGGTGLLLFMLLGGSEMWSFSFIPLFIGIGYMIVYFLERDSRPV